MTRRLPSLLTCLVVLGCGSAPQPKAIRPSKVASPRTSVERVSASVLEAVDLAEVEPGTYGPLTVSLSDGTMAIWATQGQEIRTLNATALDRRGQVRSGPRSIGEVQGAIGLMTAKSVLAARAVALVYAVQTEAQTTQLNFLLLDEQGQPKSQPVELVTTASSLLWTDVEETASGPIVFYATGQDNAAEIRAIGLGANGTIRFADREVIGNARAWQVAPRPNGAALAVVRGDRRAGNVELHLLDADAAPRQKPVVLASEAPVEPDLDLAQVGSNYVVAWSERRHIDARLLVSAVDPTGNVVTPAEFATGALGEQALVKLVPSGVLGRAALVWEELNLPSDRRRVSMVELDDMAKRVSDVASLPCSAQTGQLPEIVATPRGWSVLTVDDGASSRNGEQTEPMPIYLELGPTLVPQSATLLRFGGSGESPLLAWGLYCRDDCRATVAFDGPRVRLKTAIFPTTASVGSAPLKLDTAASEPASRPLPRLVQLESLLQVEPLSDFSVVEVAGRFYLSYVTYFDSAAPLVPLVAPGPDGRKEPLQARVDSIAFSSSLRSHDTATVSYRATSQPGLSIAATGSGDGERILAWSAMAQGSPQLFLSRIAADGKKLGQRMLTQRKGGLDDVTVVPAGDGFLAAWIDERATTPALYATRVTKMLERRGTEQRVSGGTGQVTSLTLLSREGHVLAVWSEVRVEGNERRVNLYSRRLSLLDGAPLAPPERVLQLTGAVRFLAATRYEAGTLLSWLEVIRDGNAVDEPGRIRFLRLDENGQAMGPTTGLSDTAIAPVSVAVDCPERLCHGVVNLDLGGRGQLAGFVFDPTQASVPELTPLVQSLGTVEQNVPPVLLGTQLFALDQIDAEHMRLMHATVDWGQK